MIWQVLAAAIGSLGLSVLFHAPLKQYLFCSLTGAFTWFVYLLSQSFFQSTIAASFISTLALTVLCHFLSVRRRAPIIIFLFAGIFPLVPGSSIYYTAFYLMQNDSPAALQYGLQALGVTLAIALGILFASGFQKKTSSSQK